MSRVNPKFATELSKYGSSDFNACFNCGNCTATCSLSTADSSFPREMIRYTTLGLEDDIKASLKPWECYYCGECSTECPRQAEPGELMMSLRRWLTAQYDWTGLSGLMYKSLPLSIAAFILTFAGVIAFAFSVGFELEKMIHSFICEANLKPKIVQLTGNALEIIPTLKQSFDFVFIDADKRNYKNYLDLVIDKVNSGGYILTDNVLWSGKVTLPVDKMDLDTKLIDEYNEYIKSHSKLKSILLPVRDGLYLSRKI